MPDPTGWYDSHSSELVSRFERIDPAAVHHWLEGILGDRPGTVLDIGAGSGRNAAWFAAQGHDVVAMEPSIGMRSSAQRRHPDPRIRWIDDQLPDLHVVSRLGIGFDTVMVSPFGLGNPSSRLHLPRSRG